MWYRVADLTPGLRTHSEIRRHIYRGEVWYILQNHASGRVHRFSPSAHHVIGLLDGKRSIQQIWDMAEDALGDEAPTQEETIELLAQMHAADALQLDTPSDTAELFRRYERQEQQKLKQRFLNPMAMRFPLLDPDRFLTRWLPRLRTLFSVTALLVWLGVVVASLVAAAMHWSELTHNVTDRVLSPQNLILIWLSYPLIKLLHELGHGFAVKYWGGEVHEMGIMLLVLMPMPYVDASAASAFADRRHRMLVGAAGIMVEMFIAALAMFVWLAVEPGLVRALAFNAMLIGGLSTIIFNGNPLLRFDGYYIFADAVETPNLASRANRYLGYLCQRYLFGVDEAVSPATTRGERRWFLIYAPAAFTYRMLILFVIVLFIGSKFFVIGIVLALWAVAMQIVVPLLKKLGFLLHDARLQRHRSRALTVTGSVFLLVSGLLFWAPAPLWTQAEGVVWAPQQAEVRAGADGIVVELIAGPDQRVQPGDPLIRLEDPWLRTNVEMLEADRREVLARYEAARASNQVEAEMLKEQLATTTADLALARERLDALTIRSAESGVFLLDRPQDLLGRYLRRGDLLGFVADLSQATVRVAVTQADIGLIRERNQEVRVRLFDRLEEPVTARISRQVPTATDRLPSAVLGTRGGGSIPVDPQDKKGIKALQDIFDVELKLEQSVERLGGRARVRFDHGSEPLAWQGYRRLRQLFLRQFNV